MAFVVEASVLFIVGELFTFVGAASIPSKGEEGRHFARYCCQLIMCCVTLESSRNRGKPS